MTQAEQAVAFAALHQKGNPLNLYNIWDAGSARVIVGAGAKAVATGSWSVAASQGFDDGEQLPLEMALMTIHRICKSVDVPVSLDFEGAYATGPTAVATNVTRAMKLGVVGINLEDQVVGGKGLYKLADQVKRIAAARAAAQEFGIELFINARTDVFLNEPNREWHAGLMPHAMERLSAYADAGASGLFVPGLVDGALIGRLCDAYDLPLNVMRVPDALPLAELTELGVARISHGPGPYRQAMHDLALSYLAGMT
ncbi:isocitrate lyase/phosphoenolpyruvate mutase family protein [Cognatishimia sp. SS12]|uniref:isocitrate lyase/PEP mutase family protein n=1 Tax=Cognatishimia sp. SS12 TaxID=2979465 RepID=UPI00232E7F57|nr:isocitrate lyase/phosphoenolpyruvate mutase family protein [Cognatishimia sp. SS12]MDC0737876.1 isocitrate lyase/phosphoenolpyruvate mutase family protein [Cognatishimia sp. SS12]